VVSRHILKIEVSANTPDRLECAGKIFGMPQVAVLARLMKWLEEQPDDIQFAILGMHSVPAESKDITIAVLKEMLAKP
jgi:hypothetical protein